MKHHKHSNALFWMLLGGSFVAIVVVWLPTLKKNVSILTSSMSSEVVNPTSEVVTQLSEMRKSFDSYFTETYKKLEQTTKAVNVIDKAADNLKKELESDSVRLPVSEALETAMPVEARETKKYCTRQGGYEQQRKGLGTMTYYVCIFSDGSECEEIAFMKQECQKGQYKIAEKGIAKKADLAVTVERGGYCTYQERKEIWTDEKDATSLCVKNVAVFNNGWVTAPRSHALINNTFYAIPQLKPGEAHVVTDILTVPKTSAATTIQITVDAKKQIDELWEDNNTFIFPSIKK